MLGRVVAWFSRDPDDATDRWLNTLRRIAVLGAAFAFVAGTVLALVQVVGWVARVGDADDSSISAEVASEPVLDDRYVNSRFGYSFRFPSAWLQIESDNSDGVQLTPPDPGTGVLVSAFGSHVIDDYDYDSNLTSPDGPDILDATWYQIPIYTTDAAGNRVESRFTSLVRRAKTVDNNRACWSLFVPPDPMDTGDQLYREVSACAPALDFGAWEDLLLDIVSSFELSDRYVG